MKRLKEIQTRLIELDKAFQDIPESLRCSKIADPIRDDTIRLLEEAERITEIQPPEGCRFGHPNYGDKCVKGVHILPSEYAPIKSWGKLIMTKKELTDYGLEFRGEFLMPIKAPDLVHYAIRREFVVKLNKKSRTKVKLAV